jgi:hypothetical protein
MCGDKMKIQIPKKSVLIKKVGKSGGKWEKVCTFGARIK